MTELIAVAATSGKPSCNVVFVHGLGGHPYDTWRRGSDNQSFWPLWLAQDVPGLAVWSLAYAAPPTNWLGSAMPLQDRAVNVLERLLAEPKLAEAPLVFICHSLGGLLIKQLLREANDQMARRPEVANLLACVRAVIFIATPHTGSVHATLLDKLRLLVWPSNSVIDLVKNDANLRNLNVWYRNWSANQRIDHLIFYETQSTAAGVIVDPGSGDAGLKSVVPIPIDANHISICKPFDRGTLLYQRILARAVEFARETKPKKKPKPTTLPLQVFDLPAIRHSYSRPWAPILLRLAVLTFVVFVGFKGIQATFFPGDPLSQASVEEITSALMRQDPPPSPEEIARYIESLRALAGEPSFAQAVQESKRGNTRIAEGIWEQIYEKRKKDQEAARKEQAEAARNLGASAAITNAAKALSWYREATILDPANMQGWRGLGDAAMNAGTVEEARRAKQRYLDLARGGDDSWNLMVATVELADVLQAENKLGEAFPLFEEGLIIARKRWIESPFDPDRARNVSANLNRVGDVQLWRNDLSGASKSYGESYQINWALYKQDTSNEFWARDVAESLNNVGDVQKERNDLVAALKSYTEGYEIRRALYEQDKSHATHAIAVSASFDKIGNVQLARGDLAEALKSYTEGYAIARALYEQDKSNAGRARAVSVSLERIGNVQLKRNELAGALKSFTESHEVARALYEQDKSHSRNASSLSLSLLRIGAVQLQQNDLAGALKSYTEGYGIVRALYERDKSHIGFARGLSELLDRIGALHLQRSDLDGALKSYTEGYEIFRALYEQDKSDAGIARDVAASLSKIADVAERSGKRDHACRDYRESLKIIERLAQAAPDLHQLKGDAEFLSARIEALGC